MQEELSMKTRLYGVMAAAALVTAGAAQLQGSTVQAASKHHSVTVHIKEVSGKYAYRPITLKVARGTKVTWVNNSDAPHTVTGTHGWSYATKTFSQNQQVSTVFKKAGTYRYMCAVHPYMTAKVIVK
jgi:plastocyanin